MEGVPGERLKMVTKLGLLVGLLASYFHAMGSVAMVLSLLGLIGIIASSMVRHRPPSGG
jgi:hypothetical protein